MSLLLRRRLLLDLTKPLIPREYRQVEYIESTGEQCIDTEVLPYVDPSTVNVDGTKVEIKFKCSYFKASFIFGSRLSSSAEQFTLNISSARKFVFGISTQGGQPITDWDEKEHSAVIYARQSQFDGQDINTLYGAKFTGKYPIYLFACNQGGTTYLPSLIRIYECRIYDNKKLLRNFIPCYRKVDGEIGMYDIVEGKFYTNQGTGEFLKGGDV